MYLKQQFQKLADCWLTLLHLHTWPIGSCLKSLYRVFFPLESKMDHWMMKYPLVGHDASGENRENIPPHDPPMMASRALLGLQRKRRCDILESVKLPLEFALHQASGGH